MFNTIGFRDEFWLTSNVRGGGTNACGFWAKKAEKNSVRCIFFASGSYENSSAVPS
jgi:hypothetical protein